MIRYSSLQEYFYKLHNLLYGIVLVPLITFLFLYWQMYRGNITGPFKDEEYLSQLMLIVFSFLVLTDWSVSMYLFNRGMQATRTLDSLGKKLDRYFTFTLLRFALIGSGSLGLAIGFYLTESQVFTVVFASGFALLLLFWPTSTKVCDDLQLKGDERTLVLNRKDRLT